MAFSFRFSYDEKVKIGTTEHGDQDVFATRVKRGKEIALVYHVSGEKKPVTLKSLADAKFIAPLTPKALDGLNAIGKRLEAGTDLVIKGVLADEVDADSNSPQPSGSRLTSNSAKRSQDIEEDEPSKKRAKVRAAGTLSEALSIMQEDEEAAKKGKGKEVNGLASKGEKPGSPDSNGPKASGGSKAAKKTAQEGSKGGDGMGESDSGVGEGETAENDGTGDAEDGDEGEHGVKAKDDAEGNMTTDGASDSSPKVNGIKANGIKAKSTKANGSKAGGANANGTKANSAKKVAASPKASPKKKPAAAKANGTTKAKGDTGDGCAEEEGEE